MLAVENGYRPEWFGGVAEQFGPRLVDSLEIFAHSLHPTLHALPAGLPPARRMTREELGIAEAVMV